MKIQRLLEKKINKIVYENRCKRYDFWHKIKSKFQNNFDIFYVVLS